MNGFKCILSYLEFYLNIWAIGVDSSLLMILVLRYLFTLPTHQVWLDLDHKWLFSSPMVVKFEGPTLIIH